MRDLDASRGDQQTATRMIAMGQAELVQGFRLIGFETWPDATAADVEAVLLELIGRTDNALVLLEAHLAHGDTPVLGRVRAEGGRIVVTELPPLHAPETYRPEVEEVLLSVLGPAALEGDS